MSAAAADPTSSAEPAVQPLKVGQTVIVVAAETPNIEGSPAAASSLVDTAEIEQRRPEHLVDAVRLVPGVSIRGEGGPAVPILRGLGSGRTLLMIDDARIVAERRAGPSATFVDPSSLGSIEISRGPGSVAYGSDAFGGVIHLRTRDPIPGSTDVRYDLATAIGGSRLRSTSMEVFTDAPGGAISVSGQARAAGDGLDSQGETIPNSQFRNRGAQVRYVRDAAWGRLRTGVATSIGRDVGAPSSDTVQTIYPDEQSTTATIALDLQAHRFGLTSLAMRASLGSYGITTDRVRATGVESAEVNARDGSFRLSGEGSHGASRFTAGVDFVSRFDLHAKGSVDDADRHDTGIFATWTAPLTPRVQLAGGARADRVVSRNRGGHFGDRDASDLAWSGFAALTAGPARGVTSTLQLASGYREPSLSDRYFRGVSGRGFVTGNPDLEPERSLQTDFSLQWGGERTRIAFFAYDYRIRSLVERYRDGADFFFRNRGRAELRGVELEAAAHLGHALELAAGASVGEGEDGDSGQALDDIAPLTFHVSLRRSGEVASAFLTASAFGADGRPGPVETNRASHVELDAGFGWRLLPAMEVHVTVKNLTNSDHFGSADALAARAPGRSVIIGISR